MAIVLLGRERFYGWITLTLAALLYFIMCGIFMFSFSLFLPFICEEFSWSRGAVSGAFTVFMSVSGLIGPLAGMYIAKYGSRMAIVIGNILGILGLLLLAFHSHLWQLYFGYGALMGVGMGFGGLLATTTIANHWFERKRSLAFGIVMASGGIGGFVLVPILMALIENIGWRQTYLVMAAIIVIFSVIMPSLFLINKPEDLGQVPDGAASKPPKEDPKKPLRELYHTPVDFTVGEAIRTPAFWLINGSGITYMFAVMGLMAHQVAFLIDVGIAATAAATAMGLLAGISTVGRLLIGFLGLKYNIRPLAIGALVVLTIGMALALVTRSLPMAYVYSSFVGIGFGAMLVAVMNMLPVYFGRTDYPRIMGIGMPLVTILGSAGAPVFGYLRDATGSYALSFQIAVLFLIASIIFLALAHPPVHPKLKGGQ